MENSEKYYYIMMIVNCCSGMLIDDYLYYYIVNMEYCLWFRNIGFVGCIGRVGYWYIMCW